MNVSPFPPSLTPRRAISTRPLVISAAFVLSPNPSPSLIPAASAITFLSAAPVSIPIVSLFVYSLKVSFINSSCIIFAVSISSLDTTQAVGIPLPTSSAWLGPTRVQTVFLGKHSFITCESLKRLPSSNPFDTFTIIWFSFIYSAKSVITLLVALDGIAFIIISAPDTASFLSVSILMLSFTSTPGRYSLFLCSFVISSACSCFLHHIFTL